MRQSGCCHLRVNNNLSALLHGSRQLYGVDRLMLMACRFGLQLEPPQRLPTDMRCLRIFGLLLTMFGSLLGRVNIGLRKGGSICTGMDLPRVKRPCAWLQPSGARSQKTKLPC